MPTVEELYRNYGILADATEQVGQVSSLAACGARRSAAFRKRSLGRRGLLLRPPAGSQPPRLFRRGGPLAGNADSGFTRESAVPGFQAPLPPLISLFSPWRFPAQPLQPPRPRPVQSLSKPCPPDSTEVFLLFGGAQSLGRLDWESSRGQKCLSRGKNLQLIYEENLGDRSLWNTERPFRPDFNEGLWFHYSVHFLSACHGPGSAPGAGGTRQKNTCAPRKHL